MSDLLRICTAGSVDDGKSTLIGRLLYEARGLYEDQVHAVAAASRHRGVGPIDFSLFTDGLKAEREQGITIDVAYRYFATARRKFILADTPGHEQYTRNMATGASTSDVAILLVDARQGVLPQSRRHAQIARLLGVQSFVLAVNKMDLVHFDQTVFAGIVAEFRSLVDGADLHPVPISALEGDNVTVRSLRTPWYEGPALLELLETLPLPSPERHAPFRLPVQLVVRPHSGFRGYAGRVTSGVIRVGDRVAVLPSGQEAGIARIVTWNGELPQAEAGTSVVLVLDAAVDVSRGDTIVAIEGPAPHVGTTFESTLVWMDERPLEPERRYRIKHGTRTTTALVDRSLRLNEIARCRITVAQPLVADPYELVRGTGSFILIDPDTHFTSAAGMVHAFEERP
jgi:sulfate adenylyltransferase large subunit